MKDINKVTLLGRLGADPIKRHTKSGMAVTHFSVATSRKFRREEGAIGAEGEATSNSEFVEETQWHRIVAWGKQADSCFQYLRKGDPVYVDGQLRSRTYEDKGGEKKWMFEVHVDQVSFLGTRPSGQLLSQEASQSLQP